jgi:hypothetical protein
MGLNIDVTQSKLLIYLLLAGLLEGEREINPHIFYGDSKSNF